MIATLRLYGREAARAFRYAAQAWRVALALLVYVLVMIVVVIPAATSLGRAGRFGIYLAGAALISSYLHLLGLAVAGRRVTPADVRESFGARFWDVVSVLFAFWLIDFLVAVLTGGMPRNGHIVRALVGLAMTVLFNPAPELLYRGSSRSFALLADSARFISTRGIEWLAPNIAIAAALLAPTGLLRGSAMGERVLLLQSVFSVDGMLRLASSVPIVVMPFLLMVVHWAMVFRGLLFGALQMGGARRRDLGDAWRR